MKYKTLLCLYDAINAANFNSALKRPVIHFSRHRNDDGNYNGRVMNFNLADTKGIEAVKTLAYHEMVHQYIYDILDLEHDHCEIFKKVYQYFLADNIRAESDYV